MIKMMEYAKRRQSLMQKLGAGIMIIPAAPEYIRNGDAHYPYRQNSDFYYLTGFVEPEAVMVLAPKRHEGQYLLFNRVRDREHEIWTGPRAGQTGACKDYSADQAYPIDDFVAMLPDLLIGREAIHYPLGINKDFDALILQAIETVRQKARSGATYPIQLVDISPTLHEMRLLKSPGEIALMQKAVDISACGHIAAMQACHPGMNECELEAILSYEFKRHGAQHTAYDSIVGAGANTCVLHYVKNDQKIADGDLVLIDAGAEYQGYAADITRTFPANGQFSPEQQAIYEIVLESQLAAIKKIKPGAAWEAAQDVIVKVITEGLLALGILKGKLADLLEKQAYSRFYMHRSGHWLGLDVHDVGKYKINQQWRKLQPGMVLTVEPGIYIAADSPGVAKRWHNIGVRIEDDVLVTKTGCEVLSQNIPKTVIDIEAIMAK